MTTNTTFHLFPTLPPEIRVIIWSHALATSRTINLTCKYSSPGTISRLPPPALLYVNREARHEALKVYSKHRMKDSGTNGVYIAFDRDIIQVCEHDVTELRTPEFESIRFMRVHVWIIGLYLNEFLSQRRIFDMPRLEELELMAKDFERFIALVDVDGRLVQVDYDEGIMRYSLPRFVETGWPALRLRKVCFRTVDGTKRTMFSQEMAREFLASV